MTDDARSDSAPAGTAPPWVWTIAAMGAASADLALHLFRGGVAFDDGALGLAARLVREGRWPHRDFSDIYSGGLALFDAGAQWLLGVDLVALRIPFGIVTILWVGLLVACFRRFVSPPAAAGLAVVAYLWGPPLYTAPMPSWYLLYLATAMIWCLFRWHETGNAKWWGVAGACIGLGLFIKVNALFMLAAAGCLLLTDDRHRPGILGWGLLLLGVAGTSAMVEHGWPAGNAVGLYGPIAALATATLFHRLRDPRPFAFRPHTLVAPSAWLLLGLLAVIGPWVLAYALHGGLRALYEGVLVLPFRRTAFASHVPPPWGAADLLLAAGTLALVYGRGAARWASAIGLAIVVAVFLLSDAAHLGHEDVVYRVWQGVRVLAFIGLGMTAVRRFRAHAEAITPAMIAGWVGVWFALLQYPFGAPNYLAYVAPLVLLAATAAAGGVIARPIAAGLTAALALWTVSVDHGQLLTTLGFAHVSPPPPMVRIESPQGGLLMPTREAEVYNGIARVLDRERARTIIAGPDAPEIYYFTGRPFQGREFFEFLAPDWSLETFVRRIDTERPDLVVINIRPYFSRLPMDTLAARLRDRWITDTVIGRFVILRPAPAHASP